MIKKILFITLVAILAAACTEKINLTLDSTYTRLVVDGSITADTGIYRVGLTTSADYFANEPAPRVVDATVSISDGSNVYLLHESQKGVSGIYETDSTFVGKARSTYTLHVVLAKEIAGHATVDASCYLPPVTRLDSIGTEFHPEWGPKGIWTIKLYAQEPGNEVNYYLFNFYRNGILMTDTLTKKVVSDDKFYNGSYMDGVQVIYINNEHNWETLHYGDTVILQMSGITKEYFDFINQVQQSGISIPFFTGPPANVVGNVTNSGIGFFAAYSNSFAKTIVK
ncbi:MAG: DUF4249 domain-containing protein [Bacteroidetes bacterium]|nr:DUF4249 domain-containing protein [Bacteroidota bacterium]